MPFNRFDIVESYYLFFVNCHGGQWSTEYKRLSKMLSYFKPSPMLSPANCTEEVKDGFLLLCERHGLADLFVNMETEN